MQTHLYLSLAVLVPGFVALAFAFIVNGGSYSDDVRRRPIFMLSIAIAVWNLIQLPLQISSSLRYAEFFFIATQMATYFSAFSFFVAAKSLADKSSSRIALETKVIAALFLPWTLFLFVFPTVATIDIDPTWNIANFNYNTVNYALYLILPVAVMVYSFVKIARSKTMEHQTRRRLVVETAFLVGSLLAFSFVLPIYFVNNLFLETSTVGLVLVTYLIFFSKTALQSKLVDLRQNTWRSFIDFIIKSVLIVVLFAGVATFYRVSYHSGQTLPITTWLVVLAIYTVSLVIAFWASGKLVKRYLSKYQVDVLGLTQTVQRISYTKGVAIFSEGFLEILGGSVGSTELLMVVLEESVGKTYSYVWNGSVSEPVDDQRQKTDVARILQTFKKSKGGTSLLRRHELLSQDLEAFAAGLIIKSRELRVGLMVGPRQDGTEYSNADLSIVSSVANEFALTLENAIQFEEIKEFNLTLQAKVDDATHKLRRTNEKLRQLDATKDDFISMASHQLRTPLTSVKGYVSMVLDEDAGKISAQQRKLLDQAFASSQRMVYLIADLLNVSRLKTGKFVIEAKPTNLADVVETELEQLKETAKARGLKLEYHRPKKFPELNLDETKIRQVIMNFSDNAIYYTPTGGTITVSLEDKPDSVELTVADNGIGVPVSEQHHLFTKFYRAGNAKKARPDGTGLGLFMAQKVIVAQGGAIIFHSEENKGSTFGFSFPKARLLVK